ncbi:hypothetical protein TFLX_05443 [Thermoflexales bacterium]|nr:hypothetical protein TFLX_05443 [Thermoflexales bacterium]
MQYFVPADAAPRLSVLPTAFQVMPPSVARAAIEQYTRPGDVILDPFVSGLGVIQAALELGRKVIAASFNPINALAIRATLWPTDARAAFTHLEDALKAAHRLQESVLRFYQASCPTCGNPASGQHFIWDRERRQPVEKHVRCPVCGENAGHIEDQDLKELKKMDARGLPFWVLHGRVVDRNHEDADRVGDVLDAYTPRAQSALSDILLKFKALSEADRSALRPALLATLDACTSLHTPDETRYPSGLKPPARFIEKNVWRELERQVSILPSTPAALPRVATLDELFASSTPAVCLQVLPARELAKRLPERSISLLVTHPPLPRPGFWSLSAVWAAWLWGKQSSLVDHLLPLLSRKRTNWDWQWRAMGAGLNVLKPAHRDEARLVMSFPAEEAILDSVALAAAHARLQAEALVCDPLDGVRGTWQVGQAVRAAAQDEVLRHILHERAEPTHELVLRTGLLTAWGQTQTLSEIAQQVEGEQTPLAVLRGQLEQAFDATTIYEIEPHRFWLTQPPRPLLPLADRVEHHVRDLLRTRAEWHGDDLLQQVYRDFPDHLTPDRALVATVIHSYAEDIHFEHTPLAVLRAEDQVEARQGEVDEVCQLLAQIGERLGIEVSLALPEGEQRQIVWSQSGETIYTFILQTTADVLPLLRADSGVLIIPGGRATLLQYKIARDARLRQTPWQVLKCSSLRRAAQQSDLALTTFPLAFGLEPPIEQPAMQIQLL